MVEEDTIVGDVFVRTTYERFILPVYMRVAYGRISLKKLIFTDCFPVRDYKISPKIFKFLTFFNNFYFNNFLGINLCTASKGIFNICKANASNSNCTCK